MPDSFYGQMEKLNLITHDGMIVGTISPHHYNKVSQIYSIIILKVECDSISNVSLYFFNFKTQIERI